jgi:hypothetical protein
MERRDIVIGLVILLVLAGIVYWVARPKNETILEIEDTPTTEEQIEEQFNTDIPEDADKAELEDVSGGDSSGIAVRDIIKGLFTLSLLVDLPDPETDYAYQAWAVKEDEKGEKEYVSLGRLRIAKGGYVLDYESSKDLSEYKDIVVSLEKSIDGEIEKIVLESSFKDKDSE